jgi:hypothetical protein
LALAGTGGGLNRYARRRPQGWEDFCILSVQFEAGMAIELRSKLD